LGKKEKRGKRAKRAKRRLRDPRYMVAERARTNH